MDYTKMETCMLYNVYKDCQVVYTGCRDVYTGFMDVTNVDNTNSIWYIIDYLYIYLSN